MQKSNRFHPPTFIEIKRRSLQKSQERLARDAQTTKHRISRFERGLCVPNAVEVVHLSRALGMDPGTFIEAFYNLYTDHMERK